MRLINFTGRTIIFRGSAGKKHYLLPVVGQIVMISESASLDGHVVLDGVRFDILLYQASEVIGLPPAVHGFLLVVDHAVAAARPDRADLVFPTLVDSDCVYHAFGRLTDSPYRSVDQETGNMK